MEHIALYRQFRPMNFDEMVEQEAAVTTLRQAVVTGKIGHAYLFCGQRGTGKTSIARVFARAINCEHPVNGNPCNTCPTCKGILDGSLMDVIEIDAASNTSVDNIKKICEEVNYAPSKARYKVYIIDEVHMLSKGASNALLKTLEEPPKHAVFLFATTEIHKILPTIISRCQRYDFRRITSDAIVRRLEYICGKEKIKAEREALLLISSLSDGAMRDALSLLDQAASSAGGNVITAKTVEDMTGTVNSDFLSDMAQALIKSDYPGILQLCGKLSESGKDTVQFTLDLAKYFRDLLVVRVIPHPAGLIKGSAGTIRRMYDIAGLTNSDTLVAFITFLSKLVSELKWSPSPKTSFEISMLRLAGRRVKVEITPLVMPPEFKEGAKPAASSPFASASSASANASGEPAKEGNASGTAKDTSADILKSLLSMKEEKKPSPFDNKTASSDKPSSGPSSVDQDKKPSSADQDAKPSGTDLRSRLELLKNSQALSASSSEKKEDPSSVPSEAKAPSPFASKKPAGDEGGSKPSDIPAIAKFSEDKKDDGKDKPESPDKDLLSSLKSASSDKKDTSSKDSKELPPPAVPHGDTNEAEEEKDPEDIPMDNQIDIFSLAGANPPSKKATESKETTPAAPPSEDNDKAQTPSAAKAPESPAPSVPASPSALSEPADIYDGEGDDTDIEEAQHAPTGRIGETRRSSLAVAIDETPIATRKVPSDPYEVWDDIMRQTSAEDPSLGDLLANCGFKVESDCIYMVFPNEMADTVKSLRSNNRYKMISSGLKERIANIEHIYLCTDTQYANAMALLGKKPDIAPATAKTADEKLKAMLDKSKQMGIDTEVIHFGDD